MRRRNTIIFCALAISFILLIARLIQIQYFKSDELNLKANAQHTYKENISELNYDILDCSGKSLIEYSNKYVLVIDTITFKRENNSTPLDQVYALDYILKNYDKTYDLMTSLNKGGEGKKYFVIDEECKHKIEELEQLKGIYTYDYNEINRMESWNLINMVTKGINKDNEKESIEGMLYDVIKDNKTSTITYEKDDNGNIKQESIDTNKGNCNIQLTLNKDMEDKVKNIINKDDYSKYKDVGVAIMECNNGKIRAMVQKDDSRPNILLASTTENGYAPGSIFKLIVLEAALNEKLITPSDKFLCEYNPLLPCKKGHGNLTLQDALVQSCNNIFAQIGTKVGGETLIKYAKAQGFFDKTLRFSGDKEVPGDYAIDDIDKGGVTNISIGQNMRIAPIQALSLPATVVNEGAFIRPSILEKVVDNDGKVIQSFSEDKTKVFDKTVSGYVKSLMKQVILNEKGTGKEAFVAGVDMGGKTGTATRMEPSENGKMEKHDDGWFIGYFKINNKYYSMMVFVKDIEDNQGGGSTAAPIFRDVIKELIGK